MKHWGQTDRQAFLVLAKLLFLAVLIGLWAQPQFAWAQVTCADLQGGAGTGGVDAQVGVGCWATNGEHIYNTNPGNVGIGTSNPVYGTRMSIASPSSPINDDVHNVMVYTTDPQAADRGATLALGGMINNAGTSVWDFATISGRKEGSTDGQRAGYLQFSTQRPGNGEVEAMRITSSGNVGIGTANPQAKLHVAGPVICDGGCTSSSRALKDHIRELALEDALAALQDLQPTQFIYKSTGEQGVGFVAEEVPVLVAKRGRKGLDAMDMVAVLTKVVQHQQKVLAAQQQELVALKASLSNTKK